MKRFLLPGMGLVCVLAICLIIERGHAQLPGEPGAPSAVLKQPWETGPKASAPAAAPPYVQSLFNRPGGLNPSVPDLAGLNPAADLDNRLPEWQERPDANRDLAVTREHGPWMIFIETYFGPDAPQLARQLVMELRNAYKLNAYVYNHGAEERKKEFERRREIIQKQLQFFKEKNLPANTPLRVRGIRVEEQCAVLVGGYKDDVAARRALDHLRGLKPPDPKKVRLANVVLAQTDADGQVVGQQEVPVNPFLRAFVGRNPTVKTERPPDWDKLDRAALEKLNRDESFSLLKCPKPVTLVIKQINTPTVVQPKSASGKFLDSIGLGPRERADAAAHNAHNLAKLLTQLQIKEVYVLHTRFYSVVTVGAFDRVDDPGLQAMQHFIDTRLRGQFDVAPETRLLPRTMPWDFRASIAGT